MATVSFSNPGESQELPKTTNTVGNLVYIDRIL